THEALLEPRHLANARFQPLSHLSKISFASTNRWNYSFEFNDETMKLQLPECPICRLFGRSQREPQSFIDAGFQYGRFIAFLVPLGFPRFHVPDRMVYLVG